MHYTKNQDSTPAPSINEQTKGLVKSKNKQPVTTSRKIAKLFEKNHRDVLRGIKNLECSDEFRERNFAQSSYRNQQGKLQPEYEITRDGFFFVAFGFTGKKAAQFKEIFIQAFNEMEAKLQQRQRDLYLDGKDFVQLMDRHRDFETLMKPVPFIIDDKDRKCYHYLFAIEKMGFSTRSGQVWKRVRNNPLQFEFIDNSTYCTDYFLYNMFIGKVKSHNDKVFRQEALQLLLDFNQKGGGHA